MVNNKTIKDFYDLQTCSERRLCKIKNVIKKSKEIINKDLTKLTITDITKFLKHINNSNYKQWTKNDYKKIFKSFVKWYYKKDYLDWNDNKNFKDGFKCVSSKKAFNKEKINKNTLVTPKELEKLLRASKTLKWKALLTLLYESALRPCELVNLRFKNLDFRDAESLCSITTLSPKTKEQRSIPVRDCIVHLKRWREEYSYPDITKEDYVFPSQHKREEHLSEAGIGVMMRRLCEKAKIRNLFPYMFRHSRIYFIQKKLGSRIASKYAGHSLETSEIYNHLDSDDVEEAMLNKVYVTEELTEEQKNNYEKRLERYEKKLSALRENNIESNKSMKKFQEQFKLLEGRLLKNINK